MSILVGMDELHLVKDSELPRAESRLLEYGAAWREAKEIAEAHRIRVRRAVLEEIDAGMTALEAARLTECPGSPSTVGDAGGDKGGCSTTRPSKLVAETCRQDYTSRRSPPGSWPRRW